MKSAEGHIGRVFVLRLEDGDRIPDCIEAFASERNIQGGFCALIGGIGGGKIVAGPEDAQAQPIVPMLQMIANVHEAAAVGTIFPAEDGQPRLHMHAAFGREDQTLTGCVRTGIEVWKIGEVLILELRDTGLIRKKDPATGFEVLEAD